MADKSSNTGTGGINLGGDLYNYDVGIPDASGGKQGVWSPGDVAVDNTKKDLSKPTRIKLGQYLSNTTLGKVGAALGTPNVYPVGTGDGTKIVETSLLVGGYPAAPAASANDANFNKEFSDSIGAPPPLALRRGFSQPQVGIPDGNSLLPGATDLAPAGPPYVKFLSSMNEPLGSYTFGGLAKNLTSPATPYTVVGNGGYIQASNIRPLHISRALGSADGVFLDPQTAVYPPAEIGQLAVEIAPVIGKLNFKLDPASDPPYYTKIEYGSPKSVSDSQNNPKNSDYYTKGSFFQSSYTSAYTAAGILQPAFVVKRGLVDSSGVDGNSLLMTAATPAPAGTQYVKFTTLNGPMSTYLGRVIASNENQNLDAAKYSISAGTTVPLRVPVAGDAPGSSEKILGGGPANDLPLLAAAGQLTKVSYIDPAGANPINVYHVDAITNKLNLFNFESNNRPVSTTSAQDNPANSSYFSKLDSSYSSDLAAATKKGFGLRRGRTPGDLKFPDGNSLLKDYAAAAGPSAKYIKFSSAFVGENKSFSGAGHERNLYNTFLPLVLVDLENPSLARDLRIPTNFAEDSGTSGLVMDPGDASRKWTPLRVATEAHDISKNNAYPIDVPNKHAVGQNTELLPVGFTDDKGYPVPPFLDAGTNGGNFFTFGNNFPKDVLSSKTLVLATAAAAKFDPFVLRRGINRGGVAQGYDGNTLLPSAAPLAPVGDFIRFTKLNAPVETYHAAATAGNPLTPDSPASPNFKTANDDIGSHPLVVLRTADDYGTSKNVLSPPKINIEDLPAAGNEAHLKTTSQPNAGAYYVVDAYSPQSVVSFTDKNGIPASPSAAQSNPANSSYFSKLDPLSTYSPAVAKLSIKRGKSLGTGVDGNHILHDAVTGKDLDKALYSYTQTVLDPNRYSPLDAKPAPLVNLEDPAGSTRKWIPSSGLNPSENSGTSVKVMDPSSGESFEQSYTKAATVALGNRYALDFLLPTEKTTKLEDENGNPMPLKVENSQNFTSNKNGVWGKWTQQSALSTFIRKGKSTTGEVDGNDLLDSSNGAADGKVASYVDGLLSVNKSQPYSTKDLGRADREVAGLAQWVGYSKFNSPRAMRLGQRVEATEDRKYNFNRLAQIGTALQIRAAGEIPSINDDFNPTNSATAALSTLLPGLGQLDIPRNVSILDIENVIDNLTEKEIPPEQLQDPNSLFQGTVNHIYEKFASFGAVASIALTAALVVVAGLAVELFAALLGLNKASNIEGKNKAYQVGVPGFPGLGSYGIPYEPANFFPGRRGIGNFNGGSMTSSADDIISIFLPGPGNSSAILRFFGLAPTKEKLTTAAFEGLKQFFGVTGGMPPRAIQSVGYYTIMARALVRSLVQIAYDFKDLAEALLANPFAGIMEIFEILGKIKRSRFVSSLNIFAQLGDASINADKDENGNSADTTVIGLDAGNKISTIDTLSDESDSAAYKKSRIKGIFNGFTTKLAWASNRTNDLLMVPDLVVANSPLGAGRLLTDDPYQKTRFEILSTVAGTRIDDDLREEYENKFDSEYVPFYFQDVRTNEIVGFHAFLTSLQDDYQANYESTDGFGRVESVKTYRNTSRRISLSFILAALDDSDFDSMWLKVNKLTTLVYPQYTEGKFVTIKDPGGATYTFAKPFSQQIGASPLVRIRLGNLLRSNYSKFNVAGIFGFNNPNSVIKDKPNNLTNENVLGAIKDKKKLYAVGNKFFLKGGYKVRNIDLDEVSKIAQAEILQITNEGTGELFVKLVKIQAKSQPQVSSAAKEAVDQGFSFLTLPDRLGNPTPETLTKLFSAEGGTNISGMSDMLNESNNSITRSFKTTGGKGLAGFIESMSFDWYDKTTWDTDTKRKAPKMCKVSIGFSPIHDISPGLDANGYNRAPIYPLGPHFSRS